MQIDLPSKSGFCALPSRGVIRLQGADCKKFLQGLITNDTDLLTPDHPIHSLLLTPQGKYLYDFTLIEHGNDIYLDVEKARMDELATHLSKYKLRSDVTIEVLSDYMIYSALNPPDKILRVASDFAKASSDKQDDTYINQWRHPERSEGSYPAVLLWQDPRHQSLSYRALAHKDIKPADIFTDMDETPESLYRQIRYYLGIGEGSDELIVGKSLPLECGFDDMGSISWTKGCYMGQELTARTKYRALIKKKLLPVRLNKDIPEPGTPIMADDKKIGEFRCGARHYGLAILRIDDPGHFKDELPCGDTTLSPLWPEPAS